MNDIDELIDYMKRLERVVTRQAVITLFNKSLIRKMQVDDLLVCFLAKIPDCYKAALKRRITNLNDLQSITAFNRLSKVIKTPLFLNRNLYIVNGSEISTLIKTIINNLERDIKTLESA